MGMRLPGGVNDAESYWRLLSEGVDAITEVPASRWDIDAFYDADPDVAGKMSSRHGGFIDEVQAFDPEFFGLSPHSQKFAKSLLCSATIAICPTEFLSP
jgi:myxalamid-type polyketide synthase MxaE and MxaD